MNTNPTPEPNDPDLSSFDQNSNGDNPSVNYIYGACSNPDPTQTATVYFYRYVGPDQGVSEAIYTYY